MRRGFHRARRQPSAVGDAGLVAGPYVQELRRVGRAGRRRGQIPASRGGGGLRLRQQLQHPRPRPRLGRRDPDLGRQQLLGRAGLRLLGGVMSMPLSPNIKRAWINRARAAFTAGPIRCLPARGLGGRTQQLILTLL